TATWRPERMRGRLSDRALRVLRGVSFATDLDQPAALARLRQAGTLTVVPSLGDNSPNTVYECLEHGIPFIASAVGGIPELIALDNPATVLSPPPTGGLSRALQPPLAAETPPHLARAVFDAKKPASAGSRVVESEPPPRPPFADPTDEFVMLSED